ncbi:hypothetical protein B0H10DRAFT_1911825 [Mycena sp. CBHHK59/15]|nr:hypothetical protein B0H10DRAFT_1911825 [Mycena sp. CBHHK59/15]
MASEAQLKSEIARLTGQYCRVMRPKADYVDVASISQHKSANSKPYGYPQPARSSTYVNPNYRPPNKYVRPSTSAIVKPPSTQSQPAPPAQLKEVVLNGVAFESSKRSLVRKDLPKPPSTSAKALAPQPPRPRHFLPNPGARVYKPKPSRGRRGGPVNMTLNNSRRPYQSVPPPNASAVSALTFVSARRSRRLANKRLKYSDKPCPRFSTTGTCSRGLTCLYQHDPAKIAICWNFLQGTCPNSAASCDLSHDPTPERTPLCLHFLNKGRCTRAGCPFPHVNVGARAGVCRDFAVLGYCARGLDCDKQHVRECPDFAETGACKTKGCKLPHVIRANRNRKPPATTTTTTTTAPATGSSTTASSGPAADSGAPTPAPLTANDAQLGDEFISLTFNESESSDDDEEDDSEEEDDDDDDADADDARDSPPMETE